MTKPSRAPRKALKSDLRLKAVKVRLCDWLYRAILRDRPATAYFRLRRLVADL
jgi:hypothetical protein